MAEAKPKRRKLFSWPVIVAAIFVVLLLVVEYGKSLQMVARGTDEKPTVDFTWTPIGRVSLKEMKGHLKVEDDHAIDFTTLKMEVVELHKTIEVTRNDVIGRSFETDMSFAMFDGNLDLLKHGQMTLRVSVSDDIGQETVIERVVKIKVPEMLSPDVLNTLQFE